MIAYVDLTVRDDPPVVLYPCGTPPARLSPAIGPSEGLHYAGALGVLLTGPLAGG